MTRLEIFIERMLAQRACIDAVAARVAGLPGPVLEVGLGNGRTYDHLRCRFPDRQIFVFDREVAAHPDCIPAASLLRLGDFRTSLPAYLAEGQTPAAFIHADIGSSNKAASLRLAADLGPFFLRILAPGAYLACDQAIEFPGLERQRQPNDLSEERYNLYQSVG